MTQFDNTDVHPVADLFPLMSDEELKDLAADIAERGLIQPIVLDKEERILDGRNRFLACQLAGVKAAYVTYDGEDPDGYALAVNITRRDLRPSQKNMIKEMARRQNGTYNKLVISDDHVEQMRLSEAAVVLDHAPDLARSVADGAMPLYKAVEIARANKQQAKAEAEKKNRLTIEAPDLLALVDDDQLSLDDAIAVLNSRVSEAEQERRRIAEEERAAVMRYVTAIRRVNESWEYLVHVLADPSGQLSLAVLDELGEADRVRLKEIQTQIENGAT